ncbi:MAG: VOC family protein [Desulfobacterales bacterium]|nr:VOC family protein [Desulfobacterales bacterium]MCP4162037.1 VOC family protein [Deltaproteobacteria bacterium]
MKVSLHHCHLYSLNVDNSIKFYREMLDAKVVFDGEIAESRNVLLQIGSGFINLYDQPPKDNEKGILHHLGFHTDDLNALVEHMRSKGCEFRKPITDLGYLKYIMVEGPDNLLLELFETNNIDINNSEN